MKENLIYMGPSFAGIVLKNTVFSQGFPPKMEELIKKYPFISGLCVPVSQLSQSHKELKQPGSTLNVLYEMAEKIKQKGEWKDV